MTQAIISVGFNGVQFEEITRNNEPWIRMPQIEVALGYTKRGAAQTLYDRHADEFTDSMTAVVTLPTPGGPQETRIFSLRGCHLLAMFARTSVAKAFRAWVLDVLEVLNEAEQPALESSTPLLITPDQQCTLQNIVKALVDKGGIYANLWSRFNNHFRLGSYKQLPQSKMGDAISYLINMDPKPKQQPKALPPAVPAASADYVEKCAKATHAMLALQKDVFEAGRLVSSVFRKPFFLHTGEADYLEPNKGTPREKFACSMNYAIQDYLVSISKSASSAVLLFQAYVEAEKLLPR